MRVLVTGTRTFKAVDVVEKALSRLPKGSVITHGGASGADTLASNYARGANGMIEKPYPITSADWAKHGKAAGPERNRDMLVNENPEVVFAFIEDGNIFSAGTANMIVQALRARLPVHLFDDMGYEQYITAQEIQEVEW